MNNCITVTGTTVDIFGESSLQYNTTVDPIVLVTTAARLRLTEKYVDPCKQQTIDQITDEDRKLASEIRDYYTSKLTLIALKGEKLRSYRANLYEYLISGSNKFDTSLLRMIYRLPDFYAEDKIFEKVSSSAANGWKKNVDKETKERCELTFLETFTRNTSCKRSQVFWFKRIKDNRLVKVDIDINNPLLPLFVEYTKKTAIIVLVGKYVCLSLDGQDFYKLDYWKLEI
mgnify:CR=1 FL=1